MSFSINVEWMDAPGVQDIVDAATWGRLELAVTGVDGAEVVLTTALDSRTRQSRTGIIGSWFSLARWIVDCYWSLLWEVPRIPHARSGRESSTIEGLRPWVQRHCLLAAREGNSLPDVTIASDGEHLVLAAFPDGRAAAATRRPVSFITGAVVRVERSAVQAALGAFVETVLEQIRRLDHPDVVQLREDWTTILGSDGAEQRLCQWAARLGLEPYDNEQVTDQLVEYIQEHLCNLPPGLRTDLLDAAIGADELKASVSWFEANKAELASLGALEPPDGVIVRVGETAHEVGYNGARALRKKLGLGATDDNVVAAIKDRFGFDLGWQRKTGAAPAPLDSLVGASGRGVPLIVGADLGHESRTFRWARSLYLWTFGHLASGPRLLTRSHERIQRESRAFAAETLAPAAAIRRRLSRASVDESELLVLARAFNVSPLLIRHQLENHGLAIVE